LENGRKVLCINILRPFHFVNKMLFTN